MSTQKPFLKKIYCIIITLALVLGTIQLTGFTSLEASEGSEDKIFVTVSVEDTAARIAGTNPVVEQAQGIMMPARTIEVEKGAKADVAVKAALDEVFPNDYTFTESAYGAYLTKVHGLASGENGDPNGAWGDCSGWLFLLNGTMASTGMTAYVLQEGDQITVSYSCTGMGDDIGTAGNITTTEPTATVAPTETTAPTETAVPTATVAPTETTVPTATDDVLLNPDAKTQTQLLENGKIAQRLIGDYVYNNLLQSGEYIPSFGEDGEYAIFTLARAGYPVKDGYYNSYYEGLVSSLHELKTNGKVYVEGTSTWKNMDDILITDWSKIAMAVTAIGKDASDIGGINLIEKLSNKENLDNANEWLQYPTALLALVTGQYTLPQGSDYYTKEELALKVAKSIPDAISSGYIDSVAITIQPLAAFYDKNAAQGTDAYTIKEQVESALSFLGTKQIENGYFTDWGTDNNPWSTTQVMIVLGEFGINPLNEDSGYDFIKNGHTVFDTLFEYIDFENDTLDSYFTSYDPIQYIRGLDACIRYLEGRSGLFECTDLEVKPISATEKPKNPTKPTEGTPSTETPAASEGTNTSDTTNSSTKSSTAKTDDSTPVALFLLIMIGAAAIAVGGYIKRDYQE